MKIEYNAENLERIRKVAAALNGTSSSLDDAVHEEFGEDVGAIEDVDILLLQELDDITMLCGDCGWWVDTSQMVDGETCLECAENRSET